MPDGVTVTLEGNQVIAEYLKEIGDDFAFKKMRSALRKGANIVKDAVKARAPESKYGHTGKYIHAAGNLKAAIEVKSARSRAKDFVVVHIGISSGKSSKYDAYYARWVEFGKFNQSAKPFMRPALESSSGEVDARVSKFLRNSLKRYKTKQTKGKK